MQATGRQRRSGTIGIFLGEPMQIRMPERCSIAQTAAERMRLLVPETRDRDHDDTQGKRLFP